MSSIQLPPEVFTSDKACGEFILAMNERLAKISELEKQTKALKEAACDVMLTRLEATGQKHFAFEGLGTFSKRTSVHISFPTAENGGKEAAVQWLEKALGLGIITPAMLLDLQQARIVNDPALAIEAAVEEYNLKQALNGGETMPPSPFHKFEKTSLSAPRTRKS